jgi:hypothetical protein
MSSGFGQEAESAEPSVIDPIDRNVTPSTTTDVELYFRAMAIPTGGEIPTDVVRNGDTLNGGEY